MYNVVSKRMLLCNHLNVSTFKFYLKFCLRNSRSNEWGITKFNDQVV